MLTLSSETSEQEIVALIKMLYIRVIGLRLVKGLFHPNSAKIITIKIGLYNGNATNEYNIIYITAAT